MKTWNELTDTQPRVVPFLMRSLEKDRLSHAYIFAGESGTGKQEIALQLTKSYFCREKQGVEPCHQCVDCNRIEKGNHPDVHLVAPDGASIKKHQVEFLQKEFTYRGMESSYKVYIISEADKMTASAANSLLKFLEEPESPTMALLLTERESSLLPTVRSRSQQLSFSPLSKQLFAEKLQEHGFPRLSSLLVAEITTNLEHASQLNDGDWIAQARSVVIQLMGELYLRPNQVLLTLQDKWLPLCKEKSQQEAGLDMILFWLRDLLYIQTGKTDALVFPDQKEQYEQLALSISQKQISRHLSGVLEAKRHLNANVNYQLVMEKLLLSIQEV
ncbi:DNA polymerase III subunit delta' [Alkalicoccobacillus porphyridii]|uniref:DNA polymerase III subunit delta' n=1 Tax=Alkalicoccobacillus porphyridii TaxID=2597270 RepID=A0A553ZUG1_9BACI|nr:DNA polymerase III subunit delta' [Alkalicoccobacillus porphyridii]TSB45087.1 DNA polymerase III subunit delta' [Alkalicoccobacillus porphyridii]